MSKRRLSPSHRMLLEQNDMAAAFIGHRSAQASHPGTVACPENTLIHFDPIREKVLPL